MEATESDLTSGRRPWSPGRDGATVVADRSSVSEEEIAAALMAIHLLRRRTVPALGGVESAWRRAARVEAIGGAAAGWRLGGWDR